MVDVSPGERELAAQTAPFAFKMLFHPGSEGKAACQLVLLNSVGGNKKIFPKTLLLIVKGDKDAPIGKIETDNNDTKSHPWSFTSTKTLVVDVKSQACMTLADFIEKNDAKGVTRHKGPAAHDKGVTFILAPLSTIGIKVRVSG